MSEYIYKKKTKEELEKDNRNKYQLANHIGNVRQAIKKIKPDAYDFVDKIMTSENEEDRKPEVFSSHGSRAAVRGEYTLQMNFAGSGFTEFRAMHKHMTGKSVLQFDAHNKGSRVKLDKPIKVSWYNRVFGGKIPFIKSVREIENLNSLMDSIRQQLDIIYGEKWVNPATKKQTKIRTMQLSDNIVRVNLPGPGMINTGEYTINSLRDYGLKFAQDYLGKMFTDFKSGKKEPANVNLQVAGHSRGAVAAGESQQLIAAWVKKTWPEYEQYVKYDMVQYDPVPGIDSYDNHSKIDYDQKLVDDQQGLASRRNANAQNTNNTVFYALSTSEDISHKLAFAPQQVQGTKRIIISPVDGHSSGLDTIDESQYSKQAGGKVYKHGYTYAENGKLYRGSGINDLPEGVFIADENNTLVKIDNPEELNRVIDDIMSKATKQKSRIDTIKQCANTWFERHNPTLVADKKTALAAIDFAQDKLLKKDPTYGHVVNVKHNKKDMQTLARFVCLQNIRDNAGSMSLAEIQKAIEPKNLQKSVDAVMKSYAFDFMCRKYDGKTLQADLVAKQYQSVTMKTVDSELINAEIKTQTKGPGKTEKAEPVKDSGGTVKTF